MKPQRTRSPRLALLVSAVLGLGALLLGFGVFAEATNAAVSNTGYLPSLQRNAQVVAAAPTPVVSTQPVVTVGTNPGVFIGNGGFIQFCSNSATAAQGAGCAGGANVGGTVTVTTSQNAPAGNGTTDETLGLLPISVTIQQTGNNNSASVYVCLPYTDSQADAAGGLDELRLVQVASNGAFTDITQFVNTTDKTICGYTVPPPATSQVQSTIQNTGPLTVTLGSYRPILPTTRQAQKVGGIWTNQPSATEKTLIDSVGTGVGWTRVTFDWSQAQPSNGTSLDAVYMAAIDAAIERARGTAPLTRNVLLNIRFVPAWAQDPGAGNCSLTTTAGHGRLGDLAQTLASRYAADPKLVLHFQFFNEPDNVTGPDPNNIYDCFGTRDGNGTVTAAGRINYANMLNVLGPRLRTGNPNAKVVMGGSASGNLSGATESVNCPGNTTCKFDRLFMRGVVERLLATGNTTSATNGLTNMNVVAAHYYSGQVNTSAQNPNPPAGQQPVQPFNPSSWSIFGGVDLVGRVSKWRQDMLDAGLTTSTLIPIMVDEGSYQSCYDTGYYESAAVPAYPRCNSADWATHQRNYLIKSFTRSAFLDLVGYLWFRMDDNQRPVPLGTAPFDNTNDFPYGLVTNAVDQGATPCGSGSTSVGGSCTKQSFTAFQKFATAVPNAGAQFLRRVTPPTTSPLASTIGGNIEGYDFVNSPLCSTGQRLRIIWYQVRETGAPDDGIAKVTIGIAGTVTAVFDWKHDPIALSGNTVNVRMDPVYICFTQS